MATTWSTAGSNIMSLALKCRDSIVSAGVLLLLDALKWRHWNGAMVLFDSSALDGEDLLGLRMGDSMLIDEVLWDAWFNVDRWRFVRWVSLFFCPSRAVIYACASHLRIRNGRARTLRTWHTWRNIIFSKRNVESLRRCMEQSIGLLFSVHDSQFSMQIQAMWRCYEWCASPIAQSQWRIKLSSPHVAGRRHYFSSMPAAAGHIACCVRPCREVRIPKNLCFPMWKLRNP